MEIANVMEAVNAFGLTKRELDVLEGVLRAESNNRIASRLSIAPSTVKHHLASIFTKVGVMSRLPPCRRWCFRPLRWRQARALRPASPTWRQKAADV